MTAIYNSPFLIALGWTIASSLWQVALLWLLYQLINSGGRKVSPALKHSVAVLFLFISFAWFGITFVQNFNEVTALKKSLTSVAENNFTLAQALFNVTAANTTNNRIFTIINEFLPYLSAAYLVVLLILLAKLTRAYLFSMQLKTHGLIEIESQWIKFVNSYAINIGIKKEVKVFLSEKIDVPATLNFFKPIILLPVATFNHLSVTQVESVLLHELAHIRRNDYLINIIASVIETILFFNPFVFLLAKYLKKEREHCCDDLVLCYKFDPHSYASALLSLEKMRIGLQPLAVAATGESGQLLGRVKRILNVKSNNLNYGQKLTALIVTALILLSLAWLSPGSEQNINSTKVAEQHVEDKAVQIINHESNAAPRISQTPLTLIKKETKHISIGSDINLAVTGIAAKDSLFSDLYALPPIPPTAPLFLAEPQFEAARSISLVPGYPEALMDIHQQYRIPFPENTDLEIEHKEWEEIQKNLEEEYSIKSGELNENFQFIFGKESQNISNLFKADQKRLIAEKYLQQLLQKNLTQKELQVAQQRLLAEKQLQFGRSIKAKAQADSIKVKSIKKRTSQKAIWINDHLLPEKVNKALERLHLDTASGIKMIYAVNISIDAGTPQNNATIILL